MAWRAVSLERKLSTVAWPLAIRLRMMVARFSANMASPGFGLS